MVRGGASETWNRDSRGGGSGGRGVAVLVTVLVIAFAVQSRMRSDDFRRVYHFDELITLQYYTWAGVQPGGELRKLRRESDLEGLSRPGAREFLIGTYCAAGRWPEPNNHIIHSLLCNLSLAGLSVSRVALRLPALMGAAVFSASMALLCWLAFRRTAPVGLAAAAALCLPYVVEYSQTARGYTWMLALCMLHGLSFLAVARRPESIVSGAFCAGVAVALFVNMVNLIADWVVPVYALFMAFPGLLIAKSDDVDGRRTQQVRRNLLVQMLAVLAVATVFFTDRLPYLYSSARQFGLPFEGVRGFSERVSEAVVYLFPTWGWQAAAVAGAIGAAFAWKSPVLRVPAAMVVVSVGASLVHFALSGRFAYERNWGFVLPFVVIGWAALAQELMNFWPSRTGRVVSSAFLFAGSAVLLLQAEQVVLADAKLARFTSVVGGLGDCGEPFAIALRNSGVTEPVELSLPDEWADPAEPLPPSGRIAVCALLKEAEDGAWRIDCEPTADGKKQVWLPAAWPAIACDRATDDYRATVLEGELSADWPESAHGATALVFWYPPFEAVSVSPAPVTGLLEEWGGRYIAIHQRYQAKLEVFGRLGGILLPVQSSEEQEAVRHVLSTLQTSFGGVTRIVRPTSTQESAEPLSANSR